MLSDLMGTFPTPSVTQCSYQVQYFPSTRSPRGGLEGETVFNFFAPLNEQSENCVRIRPHINPADERRAQVTQARRSRFPRSRTRYRTYLSLDSYVLVLGWGKMTYRRAQRRACLHLQAAFRLACVTYGGGLGRQVPHRQVQNPVRGPSLGGSAASRSPLAFRVRR